MKFKALALLCVGLLGTAGSTALYAQSSDELPTDSVRIDYSPMDYKQPKRYVIKDIQLHGISYLDPDILIASVGMEKGDTVMLPGEYISGAIRRLWNQRRFSDIKTVVETEADSAYIHIYLQQRPQVLAWEFNGVRKGEKSELKDKLKLRIGSELSDYRINTAIRLINEYYLEKSYWNVYTEPIITNNPDTLGRNAVTVTFDIHKGAKVKVGAISFDGNDVFSDKRLRKTMKTKKKSLNLFAYSKYDRKVFDEDKEKLVDFYNSRGYRNAMVLTDSIYTISDKRIGIDLKLEEGNKFYYRDISWMGNSVYPTEYLSRILGLTTGDAYNRKIMDRQLGIRHETDPMKESVSSLYQNNGYLFSQIEPQEIIAGTDSIDLQVKIVEGKQVTINEIKITGNNRVYDHVIRRELDVRPGELYNRAMLMSTMTRLSQMGHFSPESTQPKFDPQGNDLLNFTFPLEEQASDQIELSGGVGGSMFVGSIGLVLTNFSMKNMFTKGAWKPYPHGENQQLSIRANTNGSYYKSFSVNLVDPWFGGKKPNSLSLGVYYSDQTNAYYAWQKGTKHFRTLGASVGIGQRLKWPDQMFSLYNEISYQSYNLKDWDAFGLGFQNGSANIISLKTAFGRNTVNDPYYPSAGSDFSLAVTLTPPYSLFDGKDYAGSALTPQERYKWIEFHKWEFNADWYFPLTTGKNQLVFRAHAECGFLGSYNKDKQSPFEGFEVGGDGMSGYNLYGVDIIGLRGYGNGSLSPSGAQSQAYQKYTMELRYPFMRQGQSMVFGLVFAEAGNAFDDVRSFDPFNVKRSVGAGLRLFLPMIGWIGIDYGYGFDRDRSGIKGGGQPHFVIGQSF